METTDRIGTTLPVENPETPIPDPLILKPLVKEVDLKTLRVIELSQAEVYATLAAYHTAAGERSEPNDLFGNIMELKKAIQADIFAVLAPKLLKTISRFNSGNGIVIEGEEVARLLAFHDPKEVRLTGASASGKRTANICTPDGAYIVTEGDKVILVSQEISVTRYTGPKISQAVEGAINLAKAVGASEIHVEVVLPADNDNRGSSIYHPRYKDSIREEILKAEKETAHLGKVERAIAMKNAVREINSRPHPTVNTTGEIRELELDPDYMESLIKRGVTSIKVYQTPWNISTLDNTVDQILNEVTFLDQTTGKSQTIIERARERGSNIAPGTSRSDVEEARNKKFERLQNEKFGPREKGRKEGKKPSEQVTTIVKQINNAISETRTNPNLYNSTSVEADERASILKKLQSIISKISSGSVSLETAKEYGADFSTKFLVTRGGIALVENDNTGDPFDQYGEPNFLTFRVEDAIKALITWAELNGHNSDTLTPEMIEEINAALKTIQKRLPVDTRSRESHERWNQRNIITAPLKNVARDTQNPLLKSELIRLSRSPSSNAIGARGLLITPYPSDSITISLNAIDNTTVRYNDDALRLIERMDRIRDILNANPNAQVELDVSDNRRLSFKLVNGALLTTISESTGTKQTQTPIQSGEISTSDIFQSFGDTVGITNQDGERLNTNSVYWLGREYEQATLEPTNMHANQSIADTTQNSQYTQDLGSQPVTNIGYRSVKEYLKAKRSGEIPSLPSENIVDQIKSILGGIVGWGVNTLQSVNGSSPEDTADKLSPTTQSTHDHYGIPILGGMIRSRDQALGIKPDLAEKLSPEQLSDLRAERGAEIEAERERRYQEQQAEKRRREEQAEYERQLRAQEEAEIREARRQREESQRYEGRDTNRSETDTDPTPEIASSTPVATTKPELQNTTSRERSTKGKSTVTEKPRVTEASEGISHQSYEYHTDSGETDFDFGHKQEQHPVDSQRHEPKSSSDDYYDDYPYTPDEPLGKKPDPIKHISRREIDEMAERIYRDPTLSGNTSALQAVDALLVGQKPETLPPELQDAIRGMEQTRNDYLLQKQLGIHRRGRTGPTVDTTNTPILTSPNQRIPVTKPQSGRPDVNFDDLFKKWENEE